MPFCSSLGPSPAHFIRSNGRGAYVQEGCKILYATALFELHTYARTHAHTYTRATPLAPCCFPCCDTGQHHDARSDSAPHSQHDQVSGIEDPVYHNIITAIHAGYSKCKIHLLCLDIRIRALRMYADAGVLMLTLVRTASFHVVKLFCPPYLPCSE